MGVGLAQGAYDLALAYAKERQQFGKPIAAFQAVQFALADMATEIEAGRTMVYKAAWLKDQGRPFGEQAAMAKLYTGELSNRAANAALQIHGGYGFMDELGDLTALPRPEDPRDRRGHERGAAHGHRQALRSLDGPGQNVRDSHRVPSGPDPLLDHRRVPQLDRAAAHGVDRIAYVEERERVAGDEGRRALAPLPVPAS